MMTDLVKHLTAAALLAALSAHAQQNTMDIHKRFPDKMFFQEHIDLNADGLQAVKEAVAAEDYATARHELAQYYRQRRIKTWFGDPDDLGLTADDRRRMAEWGERLLAHEMYEGYWTGPYTIDWWHDTSAHKFARMYWWSSLAQAYVARDQDPELARLWVGLLRSFVEQCPPPEDDRANFYWEGLKGGIRLRGGWPRTFHVFADSEQVTDDDIVLFLKSLIEQGEFIRRNHWPVGNKITFAMVGLYSSGVTFPELTLASTWRQYAVTTALENLDRGFLPDGMGMELSPGYHNTFKNYLTIVDIAREVGRDDNDLITRLAAGCERLFGIYPKLAAPDRNLPRYQDGGAPNAQDRLASALQYYPDNQLFQWFATDGKEGTAPDFRSIVLPYAGYVAMRTGWERDANYVGFDVGPIGWGHAHQDKLNVVMWAYGRMLLMDTAHGNYAAGEFSRWALDTFSHNTALVDNRPQRRKWGKSGGFMPDKPLTDYAFETHEGWDRAAGVYAGAYGLPGTPDSYPYSEGSNFLEGWGRPARHHRRLFFLHPDVVVIADTLISLDGKGHDYEIRWHLDSTEVTGPDESGAAATADPELPNLAVVPLDHDNLEVTAVSAQETPPILGWNFYGRQPKPAVTLRHRKSGPETVRFLTLLLPRTPGNDLSVRATERMDSTSLHVVLSDGRAVSIAVPEDPARHLSAAWLEPAK